MEAREHVKRFWSFQNKKAIGTSFIVFANIYSVALIFTLIVGRMIAVNAVLITGIWLLLFIIFAFEVILNVFMAHSKTTKIMTYREHMTHSKNMGKMIIVMVVAVLAFMIPVIFIPQYSILLLLFAIGGIILALYASFILFFGYAYTDLALAAIIIWIFFIIGTWEVMNYTNSLQIFDSASFLIMSVTLIILLSASGLMMLNSAANEFEKEIKRISGRTR